MKSLALALFLSMIAIQSQAGVASNFSCMVSCVTNSCMLGNAKNIQLDAVSAHEGLDNANNSPEDLQKVETTFGEDWFDLSGAKLRIANDGAFSVTFSSDSNKDLFFTELSSFPAFKNAGFGFRNRWIAVSCWIK